MTTMDVKTVSWVGDIVQKFEAMCVEVEETMYQDSVKYVENQVKTVGACVKRFYSDVMQDLLPLSSDDPVKLENTGLKLKDYADDGIYESDVDVQRVQVNSESGHDSSQTVGNRLSSGSYNSSSLYELPSEESTAVKCLSFHGKQSGTEELCLCNNNKSEVKFCPEISDSEIVDSQLDLFSKDDESTSGLRKMSDETAECLATSITSSSSNPAVWEEFGNDEDNRDMSKFYDEDNRDLSKFSDAGSYESDGYEFESDDIDKESFQVSEQLGKLKLDESCVLVDKYENFSASTLEGKQRSYKKKIRDVFYLRRWSSSKKLEQLNVCQEDMDSSKNGRKETTVSASTLESDKTNLQSSSLESGWEIL